MKGTDLKKRLQQEQVMTALDLAELDKEGVIVFFGDHPGHPFMGERGMTIHSGMLKV
jgi:hypothetical protein